MDYTLATARSIPLYTCTLCNTPRDVGLLRKEYAAYNTCKQLKIKKRQSSCTWVVHKFTQKKRWFIHWTGST